MSDVSERNRSHFSATDCMFGSVGQRWCSSRADAGREAKHGGGSNEHVAQAGRHALVGQDFPDRSSEESRQREISTSCMAANPGSMPPRSPTRWFSTFCE
jgi:hypothetical protein